MHHFLIPALIVAAVTSGVAAPLAAQQLELFALWSDHMVLPAGEPVAMRGRAAAGAAVEVACSWSEQALHGVVDAQGRFVVTVTPPIPGDGRSHGGPQHIVVRCGDEEVRIEDVLVGDVWLASGQSNMEMTLGATGGWMVGVDDWQREVAAADVPMLRFFTVEKRTAAGPQSDVRGSWKVCSPATAGACSAVAYYFGRDLVRRLQQPVGLVVSSWGGTVCEAWTSPEGLADFPEFQPAVERLRTPEDHAQSDQRFWRAVDARTPMPGAGGERGDASEWSPVAMPHLWSRQGLADFDGVAFYRTRVDVPASWAGRELRVALGAIDDMDTVWFGARRIGGHEGAGSWQTLREYRVPAEVVTAGSHDLFVRVVDTGGEGGFTSQAEALRVFPLTGGDGNRGLADGWWMRRGPALAELPPPPRPVGQGPNVPTVLYQGMIAPLVDWPIRGVVWYQGESNRGRHEQYARLFPRMIEDWRRAFGRRLPFYYVQIAPFGYGGDTGETFRLRLAQRAALALPETGMVVSGDVGDPKDIHPRNKRSIGQRLARKALALTYGVAGIASQEPEPLAAVRVDGAVRVRFGSVGDGLRLLDGPVAVEVQRQDGWFGPVEVRLAGDGLDLLVANPAEVLAVRYCHAATAAGTIVNSSGLPAGPFLLQVER